MHLREQSMSEQGCKRSKIWRKGRMEEWQCRRLEEKEREGGVRTQERESVRDKGSKEDLRG